MIRWTLGLSMALLLLGGTGCRTAVRYDRARATILERSDETGSVRYTIKSGGKLLITRKMQVARGFLGVSTKTLGLERAQQLGLEPFEGVYIDGVEAQSPAQRSGLQPGDVLLEVQGKALHSQDQFRYLVANSDVSQNIQLLIRRGQENRVINVQLDEQFEDESRDSLINLEVQSDARMVGIELSDIPADIATEMWGTEGSSRTIVSNVITGGPAYFAGLRVGDVIQRCNGKVVAKADEFFAELRRAGAGETVDVVLYSNDGGDPIELEVDDDFQGGAWFGIPLVLNYENDHRHTDLDLLLGLLLNYELEYHATPERKPSSRSEFGLVLDLFEIESSDDYTCLSLLWFINLRFD
ncbi:MAG: PDZ domain-containing protein [Planctomycetota bacterium]